MTSRRSSNSTSGASKARMGRRSSDLQSTFLNLLGDGAAEPGSGTQPVDPTEMVSQMVSLNQCSDRSSSRIKSRRSPAPTGTPGDEYRNSGRGAAAQRAGRHRDHGQPVEARPRDRQCYNAAGVSACGCVVYQRGVGASRRTCSGSGQRGSHESLRQSWDSQTNHLSHLYRSTLNVSLFSDTAFRACSHVFVVVEQ